MIPHPDSSVNAKQIVKAPLSIARAVIAMERGFLKKILQIVLIWGEVLLASLPLAALDTIDINTCNPNCVIGKNLEILEDKSNLLTIEDIRGADDLGNDERRDARPCVSTTIRDTTNGNSTTTETCWKKSESDKPNFGFSSSAYWVRFKVENKKDKPVKYFLELDYPPLDYAHFYYEENSKIMEIVLGDMIPFSKRTIANRNPIFEIKVKSKEIRMLYMKFSTQSSFTIPLTIWESNSFYHADHNVQMYYGIYFGIFLVMALYNLFLYFSVKDNIYLSYVVYLIGMFSFMFVFSGFAYEYFFPEKPILINKLLISTIGLIGFVIALFGRNFLNTRILLPSIDKLLKIYLLINFLIIICESFFPYSVLAITGSAVNLINAITLFLAAIWLFRKGFRQARFYLLAWTIFLLSGILFFGKNFGLLPNIFFTSHGLEIGSALEAILFSLALADRINILKKEKEDSQKALIAKQEESIAAQKELIHSYARFVPEQLLTFLGKDIITKVGLGDSVQKDMTILFSDIRAFTSISETLSPSENFGFINSYLETMGPIIRKHNGFIDKYIGDAIMALFPQKPSDAIDASIEMLEELYKLNVKRKTKGFAPISIGIGIHTGSQMLGIIGEKERMEGTVISDVVNTASRLEGLTKAYSTALLISEDVLEGVADKSKYEYRFLDTVKVKGKNKAVRILEILNGVSPRIRELKMETKPDFEAGINFYYSKKFKDSIKKMKSVLKKDSKDKAAGLYIERSNFYLKNGVDPNWDGIEKLDFK
jgi:class 3 adenylate cyclase